MSRRSCSAGTKIGYEDCMKQKLPAPRLAFQNGSEAGTTKPCDVWLPLLVSILF
jgi:hypothetical protein